MQAMASQPGLHLQPSFLLCWLPSCCLLISTSLLSLSTEKTTNSRLAHGQVPLLYTVVSYIPLVNLLSLSAIAEGTWLPS